MTTRYVRATAGLGTVGTSKYLFIATSPATQILLDSGYQAIQIFNVGSNLLIWGDSNIAVNSGNYLFPSSPKSWEELHDGWSVFVRAESAGTNITITEYLV